MNTRIILAALFLEDTIPSNLYITRYSMTSEKLSKEKNKSRADQGIIKFALLKTTTRTGMIFSILYRLLRRSP